MTPAAFLSYAHDDNIDGKITDIASRLEKEVQSQLGGRNTDFKIFVDITGLDWGTEWKHRIEGVLDQATFLIPVLSPNYFASEHCRNEFDAFYNQLSEVNRERQILPILYRNIEGLKAKDALVRKSLTIQYADWTSQRKMGLQTRKVSDAIEGLATKIVKSYGSVRPSGTSPLSAFRDIEVHSGQNGDSPPHYFPSNVFAALSDGDQVYVVGRTCRSWFFGQDGSLSDAIKYAVERGARLSFVVQDLYADALATPINITIEELTRHLTEVEREFKLLQGRLGFEHTHKLKLLYTSVPIRRSRVLHMHLGDGGKEAFVRLQYDLSMKPGLKPFVVVRDPKLVEDVISETETIIRNAMTYEQFNQLRQSKQRELEEELRQDIRAAWTPDKRYSVRRKNQPIRLIRQLWAWRTDNAPPPPLCVQILISDRCSTKCRMCNYFGRTEDLLSLDDMKALLKDVRSMGTRSVVFSGGEPLARDDFSSILEFARSTGIQIGVLTNGVFPDSTTQAARENTLRAIVESCEWIQVSVDSLDSTGYTTIRRDGTLDAVYHFLQALVDRGFKNIDVCMTIQQSNYKELMQQAFFDAIRDKIPADLYFRFKFAHATGGPSDEHFLIPKTELDRLRPKLLALTDHSTGIFELTNKAQIAEFLGRDDAPEHISKGRPMQDMLDQLVSRKARCSIMDAVMFVDCNGDVYPCCYTFNDNVSNWEGRRQFRIGSWRELRFADKTRNALEQLWRHDRFAGLRKQLLPIHDDACSRCTRHLQQNEFLDSVQKSFDRYREKGGDPRKLEEAIRGIEDPSDESSDPIWL